VVSVLWKLKYYLYSILYKHWPDTREFITRTGELWNRWIKTVMILQQSILVSIIYA